MKVYISGPMTGIKDFNMPAFEKAYYDLQEKDHEPVMPVPFVDGKTYREYLRDDMKLMLECDAIYMLDGWTESHGASLEHMVAMKCGLGEFKL